MMEACLTVRQHCDEKKERGEKRDERRETRDERGARQLELLSSLR